MTHDFGQNAEVKMVKSELLMVLHILLLECISASFSYEVGGFDFIIISPSLPVTDPLASCKWPD